MTAFVTQFVAAHGVIAPLVAGVALINIALSALKQALVALHKISPPWLDKALTGAKTATDWLSANVEHQDPPKA